MLRTCLFFPLDGLVDFQNTAFIKIVNKLSNTTGDVSAETIIAKVENIFRFNFPEKFLAHVGIYSANF